MPWRRKTCGACKLDMPAHFFYLTTASKSGLTSRCKRCQREASKQYYHKKRLQKQQEARAAED